MKEETLLFDFLKERIKVKICSKANIEIQRPALWCPYFEIIKGKVAPRSFGLCWMCQYLQEKEERGK